MLTAEQIAAVVGCSAMTIRRHAAAGKFPEPVRFGRILRWRRSDVQARLDS
jgi:excisionase family DNA binding protein